MADKQSSNSAMGVALMRAIEADKPELERICYDPLARAFISGASYFFLKPIINSGWYKRISEGAVEFIILRERTIDDFTTAALSAGLDQVVILGAGFDTRAYRIPGIEKTRVFEVDHPATQATTLKKMKKVLDPLPAHVTFVPVDFNTQALGDVPGPGGLPRARDPPAETLDHGLLPGPERQAPGARRHRDCVGANESIEENRHEKHIRASAPAPVGPLGRRHWAGAVCVGLFAGGRAAPRL